MRDIKTVLSLFDGMSGGQQTLVNTGIEYEKYYASEVDKYAISITMKNFPNTIQLGSVVDVKAKDLDKIDLLIGGSPCQSFSFAGKQNGMTVEGGEEILTLKRYIELKKGGFEFEGQSYLFWEYVRILKETKPKYFFLENVMMSEKWEKIITKTLGIAPLKINSSLVSAQNRKRLYWTNIGVQKDKNDLFGGMKSIIPQPKDRGILLKHILQNDVDEKYNLSDKSCAYITNNKRIKKKLTALNGDKTLCLMSQYNQSKNGTFVCVDSNGRIDKEKTGTLTQRYYKGVENHGSSPFLLKIDIVYDSKGLSPTLTATQSDLKITTNFTNIRRLTPIECERLQGFEDDYTKGVSDSQRYKMLGNGWQIDTIQHIFEYLKG